MKRTQPRFVVCVKNKGYAASVELRKLYEAVSDESAAKLHQIRVVDARTIFIQKNYFAAVQLPQSAASAVKI
jgi:mRNA-degrading endonuclease toxin of MazEF toxin-antitoxin module